MIDTPKKRGAPPGTNNGGGRRKSPREIVRVNRMLYEDQLTLSSAEVREAIDVFNQFLTGNRIKIGGKWHVLRLEEGIVNP